MKLQPFQAKRRVGSVLSPVLLKKGVLLFCLSVLLGRFQLFELFAVCGLSFCTACWIAKLPYRFSSAGCLLGALLCPQIPWQILCSTLCLVLLDWLWQKWRGVVRTLDKLLLLALSQIMVMPFFCMSSVKSCAIGIAGIALSETLSVIFANGIRLPQALASERVLTEAEQISLCLFASIFVLSLSDIVLWGVSLSSVVAVMCIMLAAYVKGIAGIAAAVAIGGLLALNRQYSIALAGYLSLCALAGAICRSLGKFPVMVACYLAILSLGQAIGGRIAGISFVEGAAACVLYALIPKNGMDRIRTAMDIGTFHNAQIEKSLSAYRHTVASRAEGFQAGLHHFSGAFCKAETEQSAILYGSRQLAEIRQAANWLIEKSRTEIRVDSQAEQRLKQYLKQHSISVPGITVFHLQDKTYVMIRKNERTPDPDQLIRCVRHSLHLETVWLEQKDASYIWLESAAALDAQVGMAAIPLQQDAPSGDSMIRKRLENGRMIIAISDGMGSGSDAQAVSSLALTLLLDFYEGNFSGDSVYDCMNHILLQHNEKEVYATLDTVMLDLAHETAEFVKFGAPASYLLRKNELTCIAAETVPLGILGEVHQQPFRLILEKGDWLYLISDGISEALQQELEKEILCCTASTQDPQQAAEQLLGAAVLEGVQDDMSVIAVKIG